MANSCFQSVNVIGYPESRIILLSECVIYLAASPKSNSAYQALSMRRWRWRKTAHLPVPLHLRNAPTKLMKEMDYGKDYRYAHAYEGSFVTRIFSSNIWSFFYRSEMFATERKIKNKFQKVGR